ncbi:hypothetical protein PM10SUCC1_02390 [Propionigenium maris DSM 9537]|uniref:Uncharacterized protein n=1 Tax=Propionigenium maris DSM 9537 TaxID=1123000 RepID=A0A9W6LLH6_9FUSO|nr:hypothetical protein [Propionigenium maris]GLI54724.1 hypothetical protein PM10SUCC1_02390 [Propionigenium maris DSM 9537]
MNKSYIEWDMHGFFLEGMDFKDNKKYLVEHELVESIFIEKANSMSSLGTKKLKSLRFEIRDGISVKDNIESLTDYLEEICINLFTKNNIRVENPGCYLSSYKDETLNRTYLRDVCEMKDCLTEIKESKDFYKDIISHSTNISKAKGLYNELFRIVDYRDETLRYMVLYEFMKCIIEAKSQQQVVKYLKKNKEYLKRDLYREIDFQPSRKINKNGKIQMEDMFTYLRNEIGHSDDLTVEARGMLPNKIKGYLPYLIEVINKIMVKEDITDEKQSINGIRKYYDMLVADFEK